MNPISKKEIIVGPGVGQQRFESLAAQLEFDAGGSLVSQIETAFTQAIEKGVFQPGERLPPERELKKMLRVSRGTLRAALSGLIGREYLSSTQGRGNFVRQPPQQQELSILALESFRADLAPGIPLHYGWMDQAAKAVNARVYYRYMPAVEEFVELLRRPPAAYDGIVIFRAVPEWSAALEEMPDRLFRACPHPIMILGRSLKKPSVNRVAWGFHKAALLATEALIQAGHKRIGFIGGRPVRGHSFYEFHQGYFDAMEAAALPVRKSDLFFREGPLGVHLEASNHAMGLFLRRRRFTAVVVALVAEPVETVCASEGITIPGDLEARLVGEELSFQRGGIAWEGFAEPSELLIRRGFEVLSEVSRGRRATGVHEEIAPHPYKG